MKYTKKLFFLAKYGAVVCRFDGNDTYYPMSLYTQDDGIASFNKSVSLETLESSYGDIHSISSK